MTAAPSEPPAADSPTPGNTDPDLGPIDPDAWADFETTCEPPAETQQDDESARDAVLDVLHRVAADCDPPLRWRDQKMITVALLGDSRARAALAARPSADTETLRRVRELADKWAGGDFVSHGYARELRAALDAR